MSIPVFLTSMVICVGFIILFACAPDLAGSIFPSVKDWISKIFGFFYILSIDVMLGMLLVLIL